MPAATQRKLVLDDVPTLVLSDVNGARSVLAGHDEDDILALIDDGLIEYAWNISLIVSEDKRREIRIFPDCISWYKRTQGKEKFPIRTEAEVISQLLGQPVNGNVRDGQKPFITSKRLSLLFNCGTTHIINLIEHKRLSVLAGTSWGVGPYGAALVTVHSIVAFLKSRRLAWVKT